MGLRLEGLQGLQRPQPLAGSICSTRAAPKCPGPLLPLSSPLARVASMQILQVPVVQSELRIPCATWVVSQRLGPPHPPTRPGREPGVPPPAQPAPLPKKPGLGGGGPSAQRPAEHMGLPVAKGWADAMLGWFLISCRV